MVPRLACHITSTSRYLRWGSKPLHRLQSHPAHNKTKDECCAGKKIPRYAPPASLGADAADVAVLGLALGVRGLSLIHI